MCLNINNGLTVCCDYVRKLESDRACCEQDAGMYKFKYTQYVSSGRVNFRKSRKCSLTCAKCFIFTLLIKQKIVGSKFVTNKREAC